MIRAMVNRILPWLLLPAVWWWAAAMERRAMRFGRPLRRRERLLASQAGVRHPERIRVLVVEAMPEPAFPWMRGLAARWGFTMDGVIGLCLRYGIFLRRGQSGRTETLVHECVHTAQCERLGGLSAFLLRYLGECLQFGYANAPMEKEAEAAQMLLAKPPPGA
jgi:hypothetical protein